MFIQVPQHTVDVSNLRINFSLWHGKGESGGYSFGSIQISESDGKIKIITAGRKELLRLVKMERKVLKDSNLR
jgi:hypothetical protein